jgi:NADH pyrophosphatase NudC (nudix superfamily)
MVILRLLAHARSMRLCSHCGRVQTHTTTTHHAHRFCADCGEEVP